MVFSPKVSPNLTIDGHKHLLYKHSQHWHQRERCGRKTSLDCAAMYSNIPVTTCKIQRVKRVHVRDVWDNPSVKNGGSISDLHTSMNDHIVQRLKGKQIIKTTIIFFLFFAKPYSFEVKDVFFFFVFSPFHPYNVLPSIIRFVSLLLSCVSTLSRDHHHNHHHQYHFKDDIITDHWPGKMEEDPVLDRIGNWGKWQVFVRPTSVRTLKRKCLADQSKMSLIDLLLDQNQSIKDSESRRENLSGSIKDQRRKNTYSANIVRNVPPLTMIIKLIGNQSCCLWPCRILLWMANALGTLILLSSSSSW